MNQVPVTVVIPAFNAAHCIDRCLGSVAAQVAAPAEVIVVDDGSTDGTAEVVRRVFPSAKYVRQENRGPSAARNLGLRKASSPLCAFLDADDWWEPEFLSRCYEFLCDHDRVVAVSTGQRFLLGDGSEVVGPAALIRAHRSSGPTVIGNFFETWGAHDHVRTGSSVFRTQALRSIGGFREDLRVAEDLELWGCIGTVGDWGFIPDPLWVGNSVAAAAANWWGKLIARSSHCPTVEQWESRLIARVSPSDLPGLAKVRGRVAASIAYMNVAGGNWPAARESTVRFLADMPVNRFTRLLGVGARLGFLGGYLVRLAVCAHEAQKARRLKLQARS